jgi:hypothetical protein
LVSYGGEDALATHAARSHCTSIRGFKRSLSGKSGRLLLLSSCPTQESVEELQDSAGGAIFTEFVATEAVHLVSGQAKITIAAVVSL